VGKEPASKPRRKSSSGKISAGKSSTGKKAGSDVQDSSSGKSFNELYKIGKPVGEMDDHCHYVKLSATLDLSVLYAPMYFCALQLAAKCWFSHRFLDHLASLESQFFVSCVALLYCTVLYYSLGKVLSR
jgi:hypothetical protein